MEKKRFATRLTTASLALLMGVSLVGCNKLERGNVDLEGIKTTDTYVPADSLKELEIMNIVNDTQLFIELNDNQVAQIEKLSSEKISKDEKQTKMYMILNDYVLNVYQLAASRLSSDIETVYINSEDYMAYLAMLQTFVDEYTKEKDEFQTKMASGNSEVYKLSSYQAFSLVEDYYIDIYENSKDDKKSDGKTDEKNNKEENQKGNAGGKIEKKDDKKTLDELLEGK